MIKSVAVFLGSAAPSQARLEFAYGFGRRLAEGGYKVIFGGAEVGTMKAFSDGVCDAGGEIVGVFPKGFGGKREVAATHRDIRSRRVTEIIEVKDMPERKSVMNSLADCCVAIPGGFGTMDELFCFAVENEIGIHDKPAFVLNADGYYDALESLIETMKGEGFLGQESSAIVFCHSVDELMAAMSR